MRSPRATTGVGPDDDGLGERLGRGLSFHHRGGDGEGERVLFGDGGLVDIDGKDAELSGDPGHELPAAG